MPGRKMKAAWRSFSGVGLVLGALFFAASLTRADIVAFTDEIALEPIRVYAGLNSAEDVEARAKLALRELIRVGGFDRSVVVVVVPTGDRLDGSGGAGIARPPASRRRRDCRDAIFLPDELDLVAG